MALETPYYLCSSGMRQSLSFARALFHEPELVLLDEPMRSLDKETSELFYNLLKELQREEKTILLTTHMDSDIAALQPRILNIKEGLVV